MDPSRWKQIEELYHAALECKPDERTAILARADPELRREVESLLAQDSSKPGPLDRPAWDGAAGRTSAGATASLITPGTRLGPYKIEGPLGEGGMGEVFRGVDTRLGRSVAVKTSREQFSARFDREARAISSLNHPRICTLFDVGPNYLVMELCEGETLAARLKRGRLSIQEAFSYGAQIADALSAAHAKGIVHRDLKPGNVILTKGGVKVLDFGLAKSPEDETLTGSRMVVGTPAYMAPEQREGKDCDARSDIFSLGCVLYELFAGQRAFDATDSFSSIKAFAPLTPRTLDRLVRRCLAKDPDDRWQSAQDLRDELLWIASGEAETPVAVSAPTKSRKQRLLVWAGLLVAIAAMAVYAILQPHQPATPERSITLRLPLPVQEPVRFFAISPDGEKLFYETAGEGEKVHRWIYNLASGETKPVLENISINGFSWLPDSRSIGFSDGNQLRKLDLASGLVRAVYNGSGFSPVWSPDGSILFTNPGAPVYRIPFEGSEAKAVTKLVPPDAGHYYIDPLPAGRRFLFLAMRGIGDQGEIRVGYMDGKQPAALLRSDNPVFYAAPGYLLYLMGDTLVAQPFDASRAAIIGPARPLIDQVARSSLTLSLYTPTISVSQNGVLVYQHGARRQSRLTWFDRSGKESGTVGEMADYSNPALSPDGNRLAVGIRDPQPGTRDIWIFDLVRGGDSRFTFDPADDLDPVWSPDGSRIAFTSTRKGVRDLYLKNVSGAGQEETPLLASEVGKAAEAWSPDGAFLAFASGGNNLWFLEMSTPGHKSTAFRSGRFREINSSFSPDSKFVAYQSNESGHFEIFAQSLAPGGGRWKISIDGGLEPQWRGDGKELFFASRDTLMAVDIKVRGNGLTAGIPHPLFKAAMVRELYRNRYVATRDGQRFLVVVSEKQGPPPPPVVVVNWPALLTKK